MIDTTTIIEQSYDLGRYEIQDHIFFIIVLFFIVSIFTTIFYLKSNKNDSK